MTAQTPRDMGGRRRVLVVTSNGSGMGHLTRMLAVAARLPEDVDVTFASLSTGVSVVGRYDMPYEYIASPSALNMSWTAWEGYLHGRLSLLLDAVEPDTLVFDGTHPYRGLVTAMEGREMRRVWMRRGMWLPDIGEDVLERAQHFDEIIEPGELAGDEDTGATVRQSDAVRVPPITLISGPQILSREEARAALGYSAEDEVALVTLGAGNINDTRSLQEEIIDWFQRERPGWRVVITRSPIARERSRGSEDNVETLRVYPLARFARAFDAVVSACGYNAFHEWNQVGMPTLWVPNTATATDDQLARGRWAAKHKIGLLHLDPPGDSPPQRDLGQTLALLTDEQERLALSRRCTETTARFWGYGHGPDGGNGAVPAGKLILGEPVHEKVHVGQVSRPEVDR
ncbi:UDP-N-acetylglucosamine--LPS N-acetylglucosamine transferase [Nesterenkonia xinjiangensis]|uniref:UDP-N-acetylglucosamine:LPS N-acetylglucosamine transferase n=1 Tax=Nesterenkonia xinjiangensis TaxID=225327 RepID=A0A7Z0GKB5_9MICC|nr:UDP-N-acetylglucosamine--LPS N-acetylglucosamine transferase [Nesterenkonia xinjiangensis]NYJ77004.1 hypothetical protein [Nesterenkonia xinjiangensis]